MMPYRRPAVAALSSSKYPIFKGLATLFAGSMAHHSHDIGRNCGNLTNVHKQSVPRVPRWGQLEDSERRETRVETSDLGDERKAVRIVLALVYESKFHRADRTDVVRPIGSSRPVWRLIRSVFPDFITQPTRGISALVNGNPRF
jgi:hypothetical protein